MHATEREGKILELIAGGDYVPFATFEEQIDASPATIRRDLERLAQIGKVTRVRGGAKAPQKFASATDRAIGPFELQGTPFELAMQRNRNQKAMIGQAAAAMCRFGEAVMIDGGSTTLQMCPHLVGLNLQVLTNSLHIVNALLPQSGTRVLVPAGTLFREQNVILSPDGEDSMPRFHAPRLFLGAASIGPQGLMQADIILIGAERRFIERAEEVIVLADSSKFITSSGTVVCDLSQIDILITDKGISKADAQMLKDAGVKVVVVG